MKKKILLILSMCALLVCLFVISASATVVTYESISDSFGDDNPTGTERTAYFGEINYGNIPNGNFVFCHGESSDSCFFVTIFDIEAFQFRYSGKSFSDFVDEIMTLYNSNSNEYQYLYKFYSAVSSEAYDFFINWSSYTGGFTQEDLTTQYNQGKTDGVTEFKESEEYTNILSSKYEEGKTDGAEAFKSSDEYSQELQAEYTKGYGVGYEAYKDSAEYESALNTQFNLGSSTGVKNYLESEEYSNALQNEYDNGYEAATTEDNQKRAKNMLGTALGISGALIIVLLCVYFFVGRKARKRR